MISANVNDIVCDLCFYDWFFSSGFSKASPRCVYACVSSYDRIEYNLLTISARVLVTKMTLLSIVYSL